MNGVNQATIIGRLGRDPTTTYMQNGNAVTNFSLATSEKWKDKQSGEQKEKTDWHNVTAFGKLAEICGEYLKKGSAVFVQGKLTTDKYEKDGQTHYSTKIIIRDMQMLDSKGSQQQSNQQTSQQRSQPQQQYSGGPMHDEEFSDDIPFDLHERNWIA